MRQAREAGDQPLCVSLGGGSRSLERIFHKAGKAKNRKGLRKAGKPHNKIVKAGSVMRPAFSYAQKGEIDLNNKQHQSMVQEAVKDHFQNSEQVASRSAPRYPFSVEREYQKVNRAYMKLLRDSLKKHLPKIMQVYKQARNDSRFDDVINPKDKIHKEIEAIAKELEQSIGKFELEKYVEKIAKLSQRQSTQEWRKLVKKTLGIDLFDDYYKGEMYKHAIKQWVADNVSKVKSLPKKTLFDLEQIIMDSYRQGSSITQLQKDIQEKYSTDRRASELLARDQLASLNAAITKTQQTDAGVEKYKWSTSRDSKVRDCHRELNGKIFSWNDPPEMWYQTKSGIVFTGRKCHPGEDFMCRCVAIPIFDFQTIDLPIKET